MTMAMEREAVLWLIHAAAKRFESGEVAPSPFRVNPYFTARIGTKQGQCAWSLTRSWSAWYGEVHSGMANLWVRFEAEEGWDFGILGREYLPTDNPTLASYDWARRIAYNFGRHYAAAYAARIGGAA